MGYTFVMGMSLVEAYSKPHRCECNCHERLSLQERTKGVAAMMRFDDAVRGWGYEPLYEPNCHFAFEAARMRADSNYRGVPVRNHTCVFGRLVGFAVHELIHAMCANTTDANWGVAWGAPYGVPADLPKGEERAFLAPLNFGEACAWVGGAKFARALYDVDWPVYSARDVGTYGFAGGGATVPVPPGFRQVPHIDRVSASHTYYAKARKLETEATEFVTDNVIAEWCRAVRAGEELGAAKRATPWPTPESLAKLEPVKVGRNEMCVCGSGKKYKRCCGQK